MVDPPRGVDPVVVRSL